MDGDDNEPLVVANSSREGVGVRVLLGSVDAEEFRNQYSLVFLAAETHEPVMVATEDELPDACDGWWTVPRLAFVASVGRELESVNGSTASATYGDVLYVSALKLVPESLKVSDSGLSWSWDQALEARFNSGQWTGVRLIRE